MTKTPIVLSLVSVLFLSLMAFKSSCCHAQDSTDTGKVKGRPSLKTGNPFEDTRSAAKIFQQDQNFLRRMLFSLVNNQSIRGSLEIVDYQAEDIRKIIDDAREAGAAKFQEEWKKGSDRSQEARRRLSLEIADEIGTDIQREIAKVLLPEQKKQLNALAIKRVRQSLGFVGMVKSKWTHEQLGLESDEAQKLIQLAEKERNLLRERVNEAVERLKREAEDNVLAELTESQRDKYLELFPREDSRRKDQ